MSAGRASRPEAFSAHAAEYDALRRRLVPRLRRLLRGRGRGARARRRRRWAGCSTSAPAPGCSAPRSPARSRTPRSSCSTPRRRCWRRPGDRLGERVQRRPRRGHVRARCRRARSTPWSRRWPSTTSSIADKRALTARVHAALRPGGVFVNAEQVDAPTPELDRDLRAATGPRTAARPGRHRGGDRRRARADAPRPLRRRRDAASVVARGAASPPPTASTSRGGSPSWSHQGGRRWPAPETGTPRTYDRVSAPQQAWAAEQLDRLDLAATRSCVDAGCGSGKVTLELVRRVPNGRVYAVDAAPSMVEHARQARRRPRDRALPGPDRAEPARAGRRRLLQRHVSLDRRSRRPVRGAGTQHEARAPACWLSAAARATSTASASSPTRSPSRTLRALLRRLGAARGTTPPPRRPPSGWSAPGSPRSPPGSRTSPRCSRSPRAFVSTVCLVRHLDPLPAELRDRFIDDGARALRHARGPRLRAPEHDRASDRMPGAIGRVPASIMTDVNHIVTPARRRDRPRDHARRRRAPDAVVPGASSTRSTSSAARRSTPTAPR